MADPAWLLFLPHLPATPSSLRVLVWRRLRAAGAASFHGAWVLPSTPEHERFLRDLLAEVERQGGNGLLLRAAPLDPAAQAAIVERLGADRDQEYAEFLGRAAAFLAEIERETAGGNLSFAELEENEHDLDKLSGWLARIEARDAVGGRQRAAAVAALDACRRALDGFARAIYAHEGVVAPPDEPSAGERLREESDA